MLIKLTYFCRNSLSRLLCNGAVLTSRFELLLFTYIRLVYITQPRVVTITNTRISAFFKFSFSANFTVTKVVLDVAMLDYNFRDRKQKQPLSKIVATKTIEKQCKSLHSMYSYIRSCSIKARQFAAPQ